MGLNNVKAVFADWGHLRDRPFRVLAYMAAESLDPPSAPKLPRRFYAGRESLAVAIGRMVPPEPEESDQSVEAVKARKERRAAFEAVRSAVSELVSVGAIRVVRSGSYKKTAEYELQFRSPLLRTQGQESPVPTTARPKRAQRQAKPVPVGTGEVCPTGTGEVWTQGQANPGPQEYGRTTEENQGREHHLPTAPHQRAEPAPPNRDDQYAAAASALQRLGPHRYPDLVAETQRLHPELTDWRDVVILAAERAQQEGAA